MRNVMLKGELAGKIQLDTISNQTGLYGIGPMEFLRGEILLLNGKSYVSKVLTDSTMEVLEMPTPKHRFSCTQMCRSGMRKRFRLEIQNLKQLEEFVNKKSELLPKAICLQIDWKSRKC